MAQPRLSLAQAQATIARVEAKLREGYIPQGMAGSGKGAIIAAGEDMVTEGLIGSSNTVQGQLRTAREFYKLEPDWSLYRPSRPQQPQPRFVREEAAPPEPSLTEPQGEPIRVLVIPDRHNDPRHEHRLAASTWIARFGSERRPPIVVDLGDSITMDSCSRFDKNDTLRGRHKPGIGADLDNHLAANQAFERGRAADWKPKRIKTRGNHEQRLWDFENQHPENEGTHTHRYAQDLLQFGWQERPFGEFAYVNGVAFTHAPINGLGKPMGGKTSSHRAGDMLMSPLVHGHTHQLHVTSAAKMGPQERITIIQAGCALPWGEYENYAQIGPGGWWWGVLMLTCWDGQIIDLEAISMLTLRDRYSDAGGDIRSS